MDMTCVDIHETISAWTSVAARQDINFLAAVLKHCWPIGRKEKEIKYNIGKPAVFRIVHSNEENK
jgi:hypothetical protein